MQTDEIVGRARLLDNEIKVRFFTFFSCSFMEVYYHNKFGIISKINQFSDDVLMSLYLVVNSNFVRCQSGIKIVYLFFFYR